MAKNLYVAGLPFDLTQEELEECFSKIGEVVSVKLIIDRNTGRGRGYGFVEMKTDIFAVMLCALLGSSEK